MSLMTLHYSLFSSDQPEMPEGIHDRLFLLRRTGQHLPLSGTCVIVLPLLQSGLALDLADVSGMYLESILLLNIGLDLSVCRSSSFTLKPLNVQVNIDIPVDLFPT